MKRIAIYPGSFDPITRGHENIVLRALTLFDGIIVAVAHRRTQKKDGLFTIEERVGMIRDAFKDDPRVEASEFDGLLVDFAKKSGASIMIRGLRAVSDFEYEFQMAGMNRQLMPDVETVFMTPSDQFQFVSGTFVREIASLAGDVSKFVSPSVLERLRERVKRAEA
jgi:pantetheine-phosphate adenylyltransferase